MDIEQLLDKFGPNWAIPHKLTEAERVKLRKEVEPIWDQYANLPINISIDDESMSRLCQLLTNYGYETFSSCEGHRKEKPHVYFRCKDTSAVAELSYVLQQTAITNFIWRVEVNPERVQGRFKTFYELKPEKPRREGLDIVKDQKELIEDFDILGYSILDHFSGK